jgi:hypothetical protein
MRATSYALSFMLAFSSASALAHGPQLQLTREDNQIVTREILREEPYTVLTDPKRVYVIPLTETQDVWYTRPNNSPSATTPGLPEYLSGPGIAFGYDQLDGGPRVFTSGFRFELNLIDGLQWWDGSTFVDPGLEQIEAFRSSGSAITNDTLTAVTPARMPYGNVSATYDAGAHSGASFRMLGDGASSSVEGDDGVYLLSMSYASTEPGLDPSEPFYFLLHKNAADSAVEAAVNGLLSSTSIDASFVQYVSEPGSALLMTMCLGILCARRRPRAN